MLIESHWASRNLFLLQHFFILILCIIPSTLIFYVTLEGKARYAGLLLAPAEGFCQEENMLFLHILCHVWYLVVTSVTLCSNLIKQKKIM